MAVANVPPQAQQSSTRASTPHTLAHIASRVDDRIRTLLENEIDRWKAVDEALGAPFESLWELVLAGGKRLRPAFCHWAFLGAGGAEDDPRVVDAGASLEMLHTFALIHDDIMDASLTRRGMDAVHVQFMNAHDASRWRGENRRFGEGVAILIGDLAFVYADQLLASANTDAWRIFTELRIEVNVGQFLDLMGTAKGSPTVEAARRICSYKSGKYTVERPLHMGAALAGRLDALAAPLSAYGLPLGEAFQLRDDLLGTLGDGTLTGKPVGDDLREGKPTPLVARAIRSANPAQSAILATIGDRNLSFDGIASIQQVLVDTGATNEVEADIATLRDRAIAAIRAAPLLPVAVEELVELALFVTDRDH